MSYSSNSDSSNSDSSDRSNSDSSDRESSDSSDSDSIDSDSCDSNSSNRGIFFVKQIDTLTATEMFSGQLFAISQCFFGHRGETSHWRIWFQWGLPN